MNLTDTETALYYKEIFPKMYAKLTYNRTCDRRWDYTIARNIDILIGHTVHNMTYSELAREYDLSRTRVLQIVAKLLRKCKETEGL